MPIAPLLFVLAAAASQAAPAPPVPAPDRHWRRLFISPMGEPFRPEARDGDALAQWFNQADRNQDGRLTLEEMQLDAERFFATLDVGHDGEIDPDDISRYETVVAPEISSGTHFMASFADSGDPGGRESGGGGGGYGGGHQGGGHGHGGGHSSWRSRGGDDGGHQGAARYGLLDLPEPVVSADADFNRGVSLAEFRNAAAQRFVALDIDHRGFLTLATLETIRPAPAAEPNKPSAAQEEGEQVAPPNE